MSKRTPKDGPNVSGGSKEARQTVAVVLQVLAGAIHPSEAASQLGTNLPRYYILEKRALEGMIVACEPRPRGPNPQKEKAEMQKRIGRLENEVLRYQALARTSHRSLGLKEIKQTKPAKANGKKGRRRRKPAVRALKVISALQASGENNESEK